MYQVPAADILAALKAAGIDDIAGQGRHSELSADLIEAIILEAARFASDEVAPLGEIGDRQGARLIDGAVRTPDGWADLYHRWSEAGWNSLTASEDYGGQALPHMLLVATLEMWNGGSLAFSLCPTLTIGAVEAVEAHATDALKARYLPKMISGQWTGSMNLTEPHSGSDLGVMRTRAERREDGTYRIFGQKIFITYGEHDFTENIIHLVLARLPDAPEGSRGISLFLVPKYLLNDDGSLGARNDVYCHSIEHKLGIHASPTCTMIFGDGKFGQQKGAIGWLVGEENKGLACMFTMMNNARLAVGMQGVAICEAATQKALSFAKDRLQGRALGATDKGTSPIIEHPDIQRMLLTMKVLTQGARAITYACAHAVDMSHVTDGTDRLFWQERANLLTPIAKSFPTDCGVDVASLGIQVHGGMGFIEETGAARLYRDVRITPIYEGTNGIQAIDLIGRKLGQSDGKHVLDYIDELAKVVDDVRVSNHPGFGTTAERLNEAVDDLRQSTQWLLSATSEGRQTEVLAGATAYQRQFGLTLTCIYLARAGLNDEGEAQVALARFAAENLLSETKSLLDRIMNGAESLALARIALF